MTLAEIRNAYQANPFRPFILHLADSREILVHHRDFILAAPVGRTVIVYQKDGSFNIVDTYLITDIEFKANGTAGKKGRS